MKHILWLFWIFVEVGFVAVNACSWQHSQVIRQAVSKKVLWPHFALRYSFPKDCPIDISKDLFAHEAKHTRKTWDGLYMCEICKKKFISRYFLNLHIQNSHRHAAPLSDTLCLADVIGSLDFGSSDDKGYGSFRHNHSRQATQRNCELIMGRCFPTEGGKLQSLLYVRAVQILCDVQHPIQMKSSGGAALAVYFPMVLLVPCLLMLPMAVVMIVGAYLVTIILVP